MELLLELRLYRGVKPFFFFFFLLKGFLKLISVAEFTWSSPIFYISWSSWLTYNFSSAEQAFSSSPEFSSISKLSVDGVFESTFKSEEDNWLLIGSMCLSKVGSRSSCMTKPSCYSKFTRYESMSSFRSRLKFLKSFAFNFISN